MGGSFPLRFGDDKFHGAQRGLHVEGGLVRHAQVYSDAMDWCIAPALERALTGCRFSLPELCSSVEDSCPEQSAELCQMLTEQEI